MADIFTDLAGKLGFTPAPPYDPATDQPGEDDDLVEATFNGLRPDDLALAQPSQWPGWTPGGAP